MRLGITLWSFDLGYREAVDLARRAEDAGFHNLFMVESGLANDGVTAAAMIAARTSRLLVGTNIANVYLRHPAMLAAAAVAIDEIAPERLVLRLGPNNRTMVTQAGFPWRDPREVLQATTATLRAVFAGDSVPGPRHPRAASHAIPIHWAGMALETCVAAGAQADGLMLYINTPARAAKPGYRGEGLWMSGCALVKASPVVRISVLPAAASQPRPADASAFSGPRFVPAVGCRRWVASAFDLTQLERAPDRCA